MKINKCVSERNWCFKPQNIFSICWLTLVFEEIRTFFLLHKKENLKSICMNKHGILVNRAIAHSVMYGHSFSPLKRCNVKASQIIRRLHFTYCIILNTITSFIRIVGYLVNIKSYTSTIALALIWRNYYTNEICKKQML